MEYTGQPITLTPAYYDASTKKLISIDGSDLEITPGRSEGDSPAGAAIYQNQQFDSGRGLLWGELKRNTPVTVRLPG